MWIRKVISIVATTWKSNSKTSWITEASYVKMRRRSAARGLTHCAGLEFGAVFAEPTIVAWRDGFCRSWNMFTNDSTSAHHHAITLQWYHHNDVHTKEHLKTDKLNCTLSLAQEGANASSRCDSAKGVSNCPTSSARARKGEHHRHWVEMERGAHHCSVRG